MQIINVDEAYNYYCPLRFNPRVIHNFSVSDSYNSECLGPMCMWWAYLVKPGIDTVDTTRGYCSK